jgi:hypothetical protein
MVSTTPTARLFKSHCYWNVGSIVMLVKLGPAVIKRAWKRFSEIFSALHYKCRKRRRDTCWNTCPTVCPFCSGRALIYVSWFVGSSCGMFYDDVMIQTVRNVTDMLWCFGGWGGEVMGGQFETVRREKHVFRDISYRPKLGNT